jgi:hypothetical protein
VIAEILLYFRSKTTPAARKLGLKVDAVGLWSRAQRQQAAWSLHEAACHRFIEAQLQRLPKGGTCLVLGSGLLRDVPVESLAAHFDTLIFADIVHLPPAVARVKAIAGLALRCEFLTLDLTGRIETLDRSVTEQRNPLAAFHGDPAIKLVISANCLSQLPRALLRRMERARMPAPALERLGAQIVREHVDGLRRFPAAVILLTDTAYSEVDRTGKALHRHDLLHGEPWPKAEAEWDWDVAPPGEARHKTGFRHHVIATTLGKWRPY